MIVIDIPVERVDAAAIVSQIKWDQKTWGVPRNGARRAPQHGRILRLVKMGLASLGRTGGRR